MTPINPPDRALQAALTRLERALVDKPDDVRLLVLRGRAGERAGEYDDAATYFRRASRAARKQGERGVEAECLLDLAGALAKAGSDTDAQVAFKRSISCSELLGGVEATVEARLAYARYRLERGELRSARQQLERVLDPLEKGGDAERLGWVHDRLAEASADDDPARALTHARAAVQWTAKSGGRSKFGRRLATVGRLHRAVGNVAKASKYLTRSLPYLEEGDPAGARDCLVQLADIARERGKLAEAADHYERIARVANTMRDGRGESHALTTLGQLRLAQGADPGPVVDELQRAVRLHRRTADPEGAAETWWWLAVGLQRMSKTSAALAALEQCELAHRMSADDTRADEVMAIRVDAARDGWTP